MRRALWIALPLLVAASIVGGAAAMRARRAAVPPPLAALEMPSRVHRYDLAFWRTAAAAEPDLWRDALRACRTSKSPNCDAVTQTESLLLSTKGED